MLQKTGISVQLQTRTTERMQRTVTFLHLYNSSSLWNSNYCFVHNCMVYFCFCIIMLCNYQADKQHRKRNFLSLLKESCPNEAARLKATAIVTQVGISHVLWCDLMGFPHMCLRLSRRSFRGTVDLQGIRHLDAHPSHA